MQLGAGKRNRRITIQHRTVTRDAALGAVPTWTDAFSVWARVASGAGREVFAAQQVVGIDATVFTTEYRSDIDRTMRVSYAGDLFNILSVSDKDGRQLNTMLVCQSVAANER